MFSTLLLTNAILQFILKHKNNHSAVLVNEKGIIQTLSLFQTKILGRILCPYLIRITGNKKQTE